MKSRRESDEITKRMLDEQRRDQLKTVVNEVSQSLAEIGLRSPTRWATGEGYEQATMVAMNSKDDVFRVTIFRGGGYRVEKV